MFLTSFSIITAPGFVVCPRGFGAKLLVREGGVAYSMYVIYNNQGVLLLKIVTAAVLPQRVFCSSVCGDKTRGRLDRVLLSFLICSAVLKKEP